jgi:hypothetical protein
LESDRQGEIATKTAAPRALLLARSIGKEKVPDGWAKEVTMKFTGFSFGKLRVDGDKYEYDLVIDRGKVRMRHKGPSKKYRPLYGHTPLALDEGIPWKCKRLVVGTGGGALPIMDEVRREAERRNVELIALPTEKHSSC